MGKIRILYSSRKLHLHHPYLNKNQSKLKKTEIVGTEIPFNTWHTALFFAANASYQITRNIRRSCLINHNLTSQAVLSSLFFAIVRDVFNCSLSLTCCIKQRTVSTRFASTAQCKEVDLEVVSAKILAPFPSKS